MSETKNSIFKLEYDWCRNCGEVFRGIYYLPNHLSNTLTSELKRNEKEGDKKRKFEAEHKENCQKKRLIGNISEITNLIEPKLPEFRTKKTELEKSFVERRNITNLEKFFDHDFFWALVNSIYNHFRQQLSKEIFPYTPHSIIFNGFIDSDGRRGWVDPWIVRYKVDNNYIIIQRLRLSLNKKFKSELTDLTSQIPEYNFSQLIETTAHEISHCLLSDFFRIYGYGGDYSHRLEHEKLMRIIEDYLWKTKEIQLIIPLQIAFIEEKISYVKEKIWHLEEEEKEMEIPLTSQEIANRKEKREKIRGLVKYLADLQISKEKIESEKRIISQS
jgi:hypothetical protein